MKPLFAGYDTVLAITLLASIKIGVQQESNPWLSSLGWDALPTEWWSLHVLHLSACFPEQAWGRKTVNLALC